MKMKPREHIAAGMQQMNLPTQVMGDSLIEITGFCQVLLCGQRGIRSYGEKEIIVDMADCAVSLAGNHLGIVTMTGRELLVRGEIEKVEFLR